jgi:hypothetical protein
VKTILFMFICLYFILTLFSCNIINKEYYLIYHETTGINYYIIENGKEIPIKFDKNKSNKQKLNLLNSLKWYILYPNADLENKNIIIFGKLEEGINKDDYEINKPVSESYRYFLLDNWYIKTPFNQITYDGINPDIYFNIKENILGNQKIEIIKRKSLIKDDFNNIENINLNEFIK